MERLQPRLEQAHQRVELLARLQRCYADGTDSVRDDAGRPSVSRSAVPAVLSQGPAWYEITRGRTDGPEHSNGLDDGELLAGTVTAIETRLQRLKRIARFLARLLAVPSASDGQLPPLMSLAMHCCQLPPLMSW